MYILKNIKWINKRILLSLSVSLFLILFSTGYSQTNLWRTTSSTKGYSRVNSPAFAANRHIYAIGGDAFSSYEYAKINTDGSLGEWTTITWASNPYLQLHDISGTVVGNNYYGIGGRYRMSDGSFLYNNHTYKMSVMKNGPLDSRSFIQQTNMNTPRAGAVALYSNGFLYAIGGLICTPVFQGCEDGMTGTVEYCKVGAKGTMGPWRFTSSLSTSSGKMYGCWAVNGYLYTLGSQGFVERAKQNRNGTLEPWVIASDTVPVTGPCIVTPDYQLCVIANDGNMYVTKLSQLENLKGSWSAVSSPWAEKRLGHSVISFGSTFYVIGGLQNSPQHPDFLPMKNVEFVPNYTKMLRQYYDKK